MTNKKYLLPLVVAAALSLSACSEGSQLGPMPTGEYVDEGQKKDCPPGFVDQLVSEGGFNITTVGVESSPQRKLIKDISTVECSIVRQSVQSSDGAESAPIPTYYLDLLKDDDKTASRISAALKKGGYTEVSDGTFSKSENWVQVVQKPAGELGIKGDQAYVVFVSYSLEGQPSDSDLTDPTE